MSVPFSGTTRALRADRGRGTIALQLAGAAVVAAWAAWMGAARLTLYEGSSAARIEADRAVHPVDAPSGGRVVDASGLRLGAAVHAGDVLVALDGRAERIELERERGHLASLRDERVALAARLEDEQRILARSRDALAASAGESAARVRQAESASRFADAQAGRGAVMGAAGAISDAEVGRLRATAEQASADVQRARAAGASADAQGREGIAEGEARIDQLRGELASLDADSARSAAAVRRWEIEVERKTLRAPVDGRLARVEAVRPGEVLAPGARVAEVVPPGSLRIVAELPVRATGRVRVGQSATLRLDAFPPTRYGVVLARVARVGAEPRGGRVRVECEVVSAPPGIPLQHGLAGALEIAVGAATPAELLAGAADRAVRGGER
jgi:membrane fusion protein (multidrug efflux system)